MILDEKYKNLPQTNYYKMEKMCRLRRWKIILKKSNQTTFGKFRMTFLIEKIFGVIF